MKLQPRFRTWLFGNCLAVVLFCLCPRDSVGQESGGSAAPQKTDEAKGVSLLERDWKGVQQLVRQQRGKVVVIDIWTTTCATCVSEFPEFVALQRKLDSERVVFMSLNCDYDGIESKPPAFYRPQVVKFLEEQQASFPNVLLTVPFIDFLEQIDLSSTPAVLVYGADGRLAKRFDNDDATSEADEFSVAQVEAFVGRLLAPRD